MRVATYRGTTVYIYIYIFIYLFILQLCVLSGGQEFQKNTFRIKRRGKKRNQ